MLYTSILCSWTIISCLNEKVPLISQSIGHFSHYLTRAIFDKDKFSQWILAGCYQRALAEVLQAKVFCLSIFYFVWKKRWKLSVTEIWGLFFHRYLKASASEIYSSGVFVSRHSPWRRSDKIRDLEKGSPQWKITTHSEPEFKVFVHTPTKSHGVGGIVSFRL